MMSGCGIGRVRRIGRLLREETRLAQRAVDLVRADVLEAEFVVCGSWFAVRGAPVGERGLQERGRARHVRADELAGAVDRAVHMRFRREVENRIGLEFRERPIHRRRIADVGLEEGQPRVGRGQRLRIKADLLQRLRNARVRQLVDDKHGRLRLLQEKPDKGRSDKAGGASYNAAF